MVTLKRTSRTHINIKKTGIVRVRISCCGYDGVMIFHVESYRVYNRHGLHRNKHTHTNNSQPKHTSTHNTPKLQRGEESALQDNPAAHKGYSHARWTPQYSTDGREDTGHRVGREMSHNTTGREKKLLSFFLSKTDECRCQQSHAGEKKRMSVMEEKEENKKWRQVEWHKKNCVTELSNGCEIHYCLWCTALFFICLWIQ